MTLDTVVIDGRAVAASVREEVSESVASFVSATGRQPALATILVGDDPASEVYVRNKRKTAASVGLADIHHHLPAGASTADVCAVVESLANNSDVAGILVQLPLPDGVEAAAVIDLIPWDKDVDGLTTTSAGLLNRGRPGLRPCTPSGVITLLDHYGIELSGTEAVVVGRSDLVGRPLAQMLTARDATVTVLHSRSVNTARVLNRARVVVVAAGQPGLIGATDIRRGAVVVDVGIHRVDGRLRGDTRYDELLGHAAFATPVPGGVGPMTIVELMRNTLAAAKLQRSTSAVADVGTGPS
ncbi:bifunctional 5,10-methylenetetrahydrofolate dehydrogenase/5,10-methenyltetrahydrofolate cyclohydrolase [Rhodococcus sp. 14-2483-1-2]|uniref:bifunctional 5,10-methylenetetrahydrofolate dehydrogenase/5,10-methenyltetrahydrofolate cyclohydrolase n=1 Tax=Rhodococcus sp. 14-2483-1-2 TaxID=2023147 RepID=UPI001BAFF312|nr:bifunctional 5,10-methylenetetrahydrofolate dehydrogenase/5,10-methenyltetrahydrofolate cyclohydrolase [Rhodococcus sp. 14-2483-1-2]